MELKLTNESVIRIKEGQLLRGHTEYGAKVMTVIGLERLQFLRKQVDEKKDLEEEIQTLKMNLDQEKSNCTNLIKENELLQVKIDAIRGTRQVDV